MKNILCGLIMIHANILCLEITAQLPRQGMDVTLDKLLAGNDLTTVVKNIASYFARRRMKSLGAPFL